MPKPTPLQRPDLSALADSWQSPLIARDNVERFTGGIITQKYIANLDSRGLGPKGRVKIGRKIAYPVKQFLTWLESRAEALDVDHEPAS